MSLQTKITAVIELIASKIKEVDKVSIWPTNTLSWKWIWIDTTWWDVQIWYEDWT